jgi:hypothetical protein
MTLDSLKDPMNGLDQQSEAVAQGYNDYATVMNRLNGDLVKAEKLAREALRIRSLIYQKNHYYIASSAQILSDILLSQDNVTQEAKDLQMRSLEIYSRIENGGPDGLNAATASGNLGRYYYLLSLKQPGSIREHLRKSKALYERAVQVNTKLLGANHSVTKDNSDTLSRINDILSLKITT